MEVNLLGQGRQISTKCIVNDNEIDVNKAYDNYVDNKINIEDIEDATDKLNKLLAEKETHIEYEFYGRFKDLTIKIINDKTQEVIKEIPPKKIIDMVDRLCELAGILIDERI